MDPPHPIGQPRIRRIVHSRFKDRLSPFRLIFGPYSTTSQWTFTYVMVCSTHHAYSSNESVYVWWLTWWVHQLLDGADAEWGLGRCVLDVFHNLPLLLVSSSSSSTSSIVCLSLVALVVGALDNGLSSYYCKWWVGECGCGGGKWNGWDYPTDPRECRRDEGNPACLFFFSSFIVALMDIPGWMDGLITTVGLVGMTIWLF